MTRTSARLPGAIAGTIAIALAVSLCAGCGAEGPASSFRGAAVLPPRSVNRPRIPMSPPIGTSTSTTTVPGVSAVQKMLPVQLLHRIGGPPRVVLYGDSLAWESQDAFRFALRGADVLVRVYPGTAICGWFPDMRADATTFHPDVVIAEFVGVDFSPCLADRVPPTDPWSKVVATFQADARTADAIFTSTGAEVVWVGVPPTLFSADRSVPEAFAALADAGAGVAYVDAGQSVAPGDVFTWTMPCLPAEPRCAAGREVVRSPDGFHFCPVKSERVCPVWSGGAFRFGVAMATAATEFLASRGLAKQPIEA